MIWLCYVWYVFTKKKKNWADQMHQGQNDAKFDRSISSVPYLYLSNRCRHWYSLSITNGDLELLMQKPTIQNELASPDISFCHHTKICLQRICIFIACLRQNIEKCSGWSIREQCHCRPEEKLGGKLKIGFWETCKCFCFCRDQLI